jgi:hypothetical protein
MCLGAMICVQSFIKVASAIQKFFFVGGGGYLDSMEIA